MMKLLRNIVVVLFILVGCMEAIWGLGQLYGFVLSRHALFAITGSFYNPGPYSGFLAMTFPIAFYEWLRRRRDTKSVAGLLAWMAMLLIGCLIPCGMSRTAWIAVAISAGYVALMHGRTRIAAFARKYRKGMILLGVVALVGIGIATSAAYTMKKDSADGRWLIWKVATQAVMERPFTGHGWHQVAGAYGQAQESYFASGQATPAEEWVAGAPEYVFNEYLQVAMAWGIPALLLGLAVVGLALRCAHRNGAYGLCGTLLSLLVFAFASYPLQFPEFVVTSLLLLAACIVSGKKMRITHVVAVWVMAIAGCAVYGYKYMEQKLVMQPWESSRMCYYSEDYAQTAEAYAPMYEALKWNPKYLFEYGHALHKLERYEESSQVLEEALRHSSDPMILNILGKNCQSLKEYEEAEGWFIRSTHRLPNRLYPYYLLAKLYAEAGYYHPEKCHEMIRIVLQWKPKVPSEAIKEMKREMEILKEKR